MDNNRRFFKYSALVLISIIGVTIAVWSLSETNEKSFPSLILMVTCLVVSSLSVVVEFLVNQIKEKHTHINFETESMDKDIVKLNKIVQYSKRRTEIEQEIQRLTRELEKSNVAQYIDINRLVFSGQKDDMMFAINDIAHYTNFLTQFGIQADTIKLREDSAVFLTPFSSEGESLYLKCQMILSRIGVFLQKTDNIVKKDDILMNIVSLIVQSQFVLVNIDGRNPNVYYELGIAHALGKPTILLSSTDYSIEDAGFDVRQKRIVIYKNDSDLETELLYQMNRLNRRELTD